MTEFISVANVVLDLLLRYLENLRILSLGRNNIKSLTGLVSSEAVSVFLWFNYFL